MNKLDLTGKVFGRLTVLRCEDYDAICICSCGSTRTVETYKLRARTTKSCGCYKRDKLMAFVKLPDGESAFNGLYGNYKTRARKKHRDFTLTKKEFAEITKAPCHYCGVLPQQEYDNGGTTTSYTYNGVDRVDSNQGYGVANVVACCKVCNYAKMDMNLDEFNMWIARLVKFHTNLKVTPSASEQVQYNVAIR